MPAESFRAFAPGRVNLIGEHTDYNEGLCLPFAIELGVTVTARPAPGPQIEVSALDLGESDRFTLGERADGWRAFVRGTVAELAAARRVDPRPVALEIAGNLPAGAGLGSSAALCVALGLALAAAWGGQEPDRLELASLCSRVENDWVGARTGLLDQLASLFGREGEAMRIDMRGPELRPVLLDLRGHVLATLDSSAPRRHAASGYNRRREECRDACRLLGIRSLRDASEQDLERLPEPLASRARHVLGENARVDAMAAAASGGDPAAAGRLLDSSHASLRDDYEVSVPAVEEALGRARAAGAIGGRLMGGGFGGHVLGLFPPGVQLPEGARRVAPAPGARLL